jgi:dolichol-phosphate mannosyltransferase
MHQYRVLIAIPAFNEAAAVTPMIVKFDALRLSVPFELQVLFVDDGSSDATPLILNEAARTRPYLNVHAHGQNRGLGAAMQTILTYATDNLADADVLVTMDGDNTHDPNLVPELVGALKSDHRDFVVASRYVRGGREVGLHPIRRLLSRGASLFCSIFFPIPNVRDYSCGYRAYNIGFLRRAQSVWGRLVSVTGFECMAEILAKFSRLKPSAGEYPLVLHYELKAGSSKMNVLRTIRGYVSLLKKVKVSHI